MIIKIRKQEKKDKKNPRPYDRGFRENLIQFKLESNAKRNSTEDLITSILVVVKTSIDTKVRCQ